MEDALEAVVQTVVKTTNLIGNGLYGVDFKQTEKEVVVIEVNDNPSIEAGVEEAVLQGELYKTIIENFVWRLDRKRGR
jgi:glutathione synthase/RimK-type ligase-like ATP-grasp enzyme